MSTITEADASHADEHVHQHPTDAQYVKIAVFLGVITGAEVSTYFWKDATTGQLVLLLIPMMVIKFATVCGYFMHLKYDNPIFRRVFTFGLMLAVAVYAIFSFSMGFWSDEYLRFLK